MKKMKKVLPVVMAIALTVSSFPLVAQADSAKVVTLGANLSEEQKQEMYDYFGTSADEVDTIEVTNADERVYMEGIATEAQIGTRTYSCSYVEPTDKGGIQVKVANLTFVTSSMIASTLLTSGVENCNVVAASPIEVSGTGALTGIMMAYEAASGEELSEEQKEAATEELITTGELADEVGSDAATALMNDVKEKVIKDNLSDPAEIEGAINETAADLGVTVSPELMAQIVALMEKISQFDYDVKALENTLDNLMGKGQGFFSKIWGSITGLFGGDSNGGIINSTNDDILGDSAIIDSTLDAVTDTVKKAEEEGWLDKIVNFFKDLFGMGDTEETVEEEVSEEVVDETNDSSEPVEDTVVEEEAPAEDTTTENTEESADLVIETE